MMGTLVAIVAAPQIDFPGGGQTVLMGLRWIHLVAGILWVGLLYFFNLVNIPFQRELDGPTKLAVVPNLMPKALWWFRWSSVVTVLVGIAYWMHIVGTDVRNAIAGGDQVSGGGMMGMQPVARVEIPAGGSLQLKPGSYHVMLIGLVKDLKAGDTIDLTLKFERAGAITVKAQVRES